VNLACHVGSPQQPGKIAGFLRRHTYCRPTIKIMRTPYKILIVEDHIATRTGLRSLLTKAGYDVSTASSYLKGRRAIVDRPPDLLITDLRLGEYNGLQLVAAVPLGVPTIVVTGFPDPVLSAEAQKLGARYITKPIDYEALLTVIEEALASAAKRQSRGSTRRWDRKPVGGTVSARVENVPAKIVNVSYGGVRFEIERDQALPPSFSLTVAEPALSVDVNLVWETRTGDRLWICGAAITGNAEAVHGWATLVDGFSGGAEA
jgi:DNA-binding response OmpR family regulator